MTLLNRQPVAVFSCIITVQLLCGMLAAQQGGTRPDAGTTQAQPPAPASAPASAPAVNHEPPAPPWTERQPLFIPSLNGSGVVTLGGGEAGQAINGPGMRQGSKLLLYGATVSTSYLPDQPSGSSTTPVVLNPFLGIAGMLPRGGYSIQYAPTVVLEHVAGQTVQANAFHNVSATLNSAFSRRLSWSAGINGGYSSQRSRFLGPLNTSSVEDIPASPGSSALLTDVGTKQVQLGGHSELSWNKSQTERLDLTVTTSYFATIDTAVNVPREHTMAGGLQATYSHTINSRVSLGTFASFNRIFNGIRCSTYGGGLNLGLVVKRGFQISMGGGPQAATEGCGDPQFNFHVQVNSPLRSNPQIYVRGGRQLSTVFGQQNRWENTAELGVTKPFGRSTLSGNVGYARAENGVGSSSADGYFFGADFNRRLSHNLSIGLGFRQAQFVSSNAAISRMVSLSLGWGWQPRPLSLGGE